MSNFQRLHRLIPNLANTFARFPVPVACSVGLAIVLNLDITGPLFLAGRLDDRVIMAFSAAFLAAGAVNLVFEARALLSPLLRHVIALGVACTVGAIGFYEQASAVNPVFLIPGLVLAVMAAAYAGSRFSEEAFWLFNARLALAIFLSGLVAAVTCGGLSAIVASLDFLFDIKIPKAYEHIWTTGMALIAPLYGLSLTPSKFDDALALPDAGTLAGRGVQALINLVLFPLLAVYCAILHIYAAKIAIQWELPRGQVGQSVLIFMLAVTATVLFARPWVSRMNRFCVWFNTWWYLFLIAPLALLAIGIARRTLDYGVTPERYGLVVIGVWALALLVYRAIKGRHYSSWNVLSALSVLLVVSSFGPWGATGYSITDQLDRFRDLLARNGVLIDGKLSADFDGKQEFAREDARTGASIVSFLNGNHAIGRLKPMFDGHKADPFLPGKLNWKQAQSINTLFGFNKVQAPDGEQIVMFTPTSKIASLGLDGARQLTGPHFVHASSKQPTQTDGKPVFGAWRNDNDLIIGTPSKSWRVDLDALIERIDQAGKDDALNQAPLIYDVPGPDSALRLIITQASGRIKNDEIQHFVLHFWTLAPAP